VNDDAPEVTVSIEGDDVFEQDGRHFNFFQAVDLIEKMHPGAARVGYRGPCRTEPVRFVGNFSLGFPASDIEQVERYITADGHIRYRMMVNFLGLYGQSSPLPTWYTEDVVHEELDDHAVKDFLDLFQHRAVSLLKRCWTKYRYYREYRPDGSDPISQWLFALMGVLHPSLREGTALNWQRLLAYAGIIAMRNHSAPMIRGVMSHYFPETPIEIEQFVEQMSPIAADQLARLGAGNCRLGEDLTIGEAVPDCGSRIKIRMGPLGFARFRRFLPDGDDHAAAKDLVNILLIDQLQCDFELILRRDQIPPLELIGDSPCRLGWSTWLGERDEDGVVVFSD
jgi:type VI secretion system protein ImpH